MSHYVSLTCDVYRTLTPAGQERAFEHETPDNDEDDEPEAAAHAA